MGIILTWDNDAQTVIRCDFPEVWTWDDYRAVMAEAAAMIGEVPHRVDLLFDLSKTRLSGSEAIVRGRDLRIAWPEHTGGVVVVTTQALLRTALAIFSQAYLRGRRELVMVDTLAEARAVLASWQD